MFDISGYAVPASTLGVFACNIQIPPKAGLSITGISAPGGSTKAFTVTYTDDLSVKASTFDGADILVTGPERIQPTGEFRRRRPSRRRQPAYGDLPDQRPRRIVGRLGTMVRIRLRSRRGRLPTIAATPCRRARWAYSALGIQVPPQATLRHFQRDQRRRRATRLSRSATPTISR